MSNYKIKEIPLLERPRERLINEGKENISNKELISIILKTGLKGKNVNDISIDLLNNYDLEELKDISINNLIKIKGIGKTKAVELIAAIELGKRIYLKESKEKIKLDNPISIWKDSKYLFSGKKQEYFYCYYFDSKQNLIKRKLLFMGTLNSSVTHTREIFKEAYKLSASSIICLHNHPSDDPTPSNADVNFTQALIETGKIQGIPIIDHIIVTENKFYSFYEHNTKDK